MKLRCSNVLLCLIVLSGCTKERGRVEIDEGVESILAPLCRGVITTIDLDAVTAEKCFPDLVVGGDTSESHIMGSRAFIGSATACFVLGDSIYVCDRIGNAILVSDMTGNIIRHIGRSGRGPREFLNPCDITSGENGILVYDFGNSRVQILDRQFRYVSSIPAAFAPYASSLAFSGGLVYVHGNFGDTTLVRVYEGRVPFKYVRGFMPLLVPRGRQPMAMRFVRGIFSKALFVCSG
jgi:hypothetical protein